MIVIPDYIATRVDNDVRLNLHPDAVTQGFAILAMRDSGKSNLAGVMQEEFARRGDQFIVIDPPAAHIGIRNAAGDDGKPSGPSGIKALIVGGKMGDFEVQPDGGASLAQILMDTKLSCVIDLKTTRMRERKEFLTTFGEELYANNETPLHVFVEEADEIIPQQPDNREEQAIRHIWRKIIKGGRSSGIGFTIVTQRPAMVDKTSLNQIDNLFVMAMMGREEFKTLEGWFKFHLRDLDERKVVMDSIPNLPRGGCWFLSPRWMKEMVELQVRRRVTFHAGRTPKRGEVLVTPQKYEISDAVQMFKAKLKEMNALKQDEANKVEFLQTQVLDLTDALHGKRFMSEEDQDRLRKEGYEEARVFLHEVEEKKKEYYQQGFQAGLATIQKAISEAMADDPTSGVVINVPPDLPMRGERILHTHVDYNERVAKEVFSRPSPLFDKTTVPAQSSKLKAGARRLLQALCQWYPQGMLEGQLRAQAGLRKSGTYDSYKSALRTSGYIETRDGLFFATKTGMSALGTAAPKAPRNTSDVLEIWNPKLRLGARKILEILIRHRGVKVQRDKLAELSGYAESGTFDSYLSALRTARLINTGDGHVWADKQNLFL